MARVEGAAALAAVDAVARVVVDVVARAAARAVARAAADAAGRAVSRAVVLAAALAVVDVVPAAGLADRAAHVGRVAPVVDLFRFLVVHLCEIFLFHVMAFLYMYVRIKFYTNKRYSYNS